MSRRTMIAQAALGATAALVAGGPGPVHAGTQENPGRKAMPFGYCLNTATIRGQQLTLSEEAAIAAKAGYQGFEPWVPEIQQYVQRGGKLADLKKRIADLGLTVPSAIGFADWINDDAARRTAGLEQWKRDAEMVALIGGRRLAAPPGGAYNTALNLLTVAQRYRKLLEVGCAAGVVPELELWGGSKTLSRLGEIAFVLVEAAHPQACGLLDVFHIYKGGSDFTGLRLFNGASLHVLHMNDYPTEPPREKLSDADRVYPGDGSAPLVALMRNLQTIGFSGMLSLELFNRQYWKLDALTVARTGLEKTRAIVDRASLLGAHPNGV
jgi:sugar phosphate isomerase/epimerase